MTRKKFDDLLEQCGFKTYTELANRLGLTSQTIVIWNREENYPNYVEQALLWYKIAKEYDKLMLANTDKNGVDRSIIKLEAENMRLEKELQSLISIKNVMKDKIIALVDSKS
ncbi:hypothetical protein DMB91_07165 [Campylobacter sp. MIT 97-5078]|nr:hypothetical protein [Campylobacter sp. MIT 97-5078]KGI53411.1 hypothetical protein LR59_13525 [Campylobacter sp. MIT 97-5078]TQR25576.1 hypothetical protein DMB91_07165 [Campylobacter sp. MIT 97-5078]